MKRLLSVAVLLSLAVVMMSLPAAAQNCSSPPASWGDTTAYESWCRSCGGIVSGSGPRIQCIPGSDWGKTGGGSGRVERPPRPTEDELRRERERQRNQREVDLGVKYYNSGLKQEQAENWAAAEAQYREALKHWWPWHVRARMAHVLEVQGKYEDAITWYNSAIRVTYEVVGNRDHVPVILNNIGVAYLNLGKYEDAIRNFNWALEKNSGYSLARDNLAIARKELDKETARKMRSTLLQSTGTGPVVPATASGLDLMQPETHMAEPAAELVGIFNTVAKDLKLPKGPATNRELAALNCQRYFRAVAVALAKADKSSWQDDFHNLNAGGIAVRLNYLAQHGGNWATVDAIQAQELANRGAVVVGASPEDESGHGHLGFVMPLPPGLDESKFSGTGPFVRDGNEHHLKLDPKLYPSTWGAVKASKAFVLSRTKWYVYIPSKP